MREGGGGWGGAVRGGGWEGVSMEVEVGMGRGWAEGARGRGFDMSSEPKSTRVQSSRATRRTIT